MDILKTSDGSEQLVQHNLSLQKPLRTQINLKRYYLHLGHTIMLTPLAQRLQRRVKERLFRSDEISELLDTHQVSSCCFTETLQNINYLLMSNNLKMYKFMKLLSY